MTPETPTRANLSSTVLGAVFVLALPFLLALAAAATFWAFGVAVTAFYFMTGRF